VGLKLIEGGEAFLLGLVGGLLHHHLHFRDVVHQHVLDAALQGYGGRRAAAARPLHLQGHNPGLLIEPLHPINQTNQNKPMNSRNVMALYYGSKDMAFCCGAKYRYKVRYKRHGILLRF
jgi:hypothetical protein